MVSSSTLGSLCYWQCTGCKAERQSHLKSCEWATWLVVQRVLGLVTAEWRRQGDMPSSWMQVALSAFDLHPSVVQTSCWCAVQVWDGLRSAYIGQEGCVGGHLSVTNVEQEAMPTAGLEARLQPTTQLQRDMRCHDLRRDPGHAVPIKLHVQLQVHCCVLPPA